MIKPSASKQFLSLRHQVILFGVIIITFFSSTHESLMTSTFVCKGPWKVLEALPPQIPPQFFVRNPLNTRNNYKTNSFAVSLHDLSFGTEKQNNLDYE